MKSRVQMAGVDYGSNDGVLWKGDLPQLSGIPGMRLVLSDNEKDESVAYQFRQVVIEIDINTGDIEQVVYVSPVDKQKARELLESK